MKTFQRTNWSNEQIIKFLRGQKLNETFNKNCSHNDAIDDLIDFSNKIVKINLNGDEYWYKIGRTRSGHPTWENFIWQNNKTEEINL